MSRDDQHRFFLAVLEKVSAAQIARETGYSDSAVSQVRHGKYGGDEGAFLAQVLRIYGRWACPALDEEVDHKQCAAEQARPYSAGRVRQWAVCQQCARRES